MNDAGMLMSWKKMKLYSPQIVFTIFWLTSNESFWCQILKSGRFSKLTVIMWLWREINGRSHDPEILQHRIWKERVCLNMVGTNTSQEINCCHVDVKVNIREIHQWSLAAHQSTDVIQQHSCPELMMFVVSSHLTWGLSTFSYRQPLGCHSCRTRDQHPQPAALSQSAGRDAFTSSTKGPGQRVQWDLREPASSLCTGGTTSSQLIHKHNRKSLWIILHLSRNKLCLHHQKSGLGIA